MSPLRVVSFIRVLNSFNQILVSFSSRVIIVQIQMKINIIPILDSDSLFNHSLFRNCSCVLSFKQPSFFFFFTKTVKRTDDSSEALRISVNLFLARDRCTSYIIRCKSNQVYTVRSPGHPVPHAQRMRNAQWKLKRLYTIFAMDRKREVCVAQTG